MSQVFLISDHHFYHERILEFARPQFSSVEEMNEHIVDRHNRTIKKRDTVWFLGDVCFGHVRNLQIIKRLNGTKNLIMGNHDGYGIRAYCALFNKIEAAKKYDGFAWTHIPIHPDQFFRWKGNIHGHLHDKIVTVTQPVETGIGMLSEEMPDERYFNVSCEQLGFTPIAWEEIKKRFDETSSRL